MWRGERAAAEVAERRDEPDQLDAVVGRLRDRPGGLGDEEQPTEAIVVVALRGDR